MGHHSCCNKQKVRRGLWSPEEDEKLVKYITAHGHGCWSSVPRQADLYYNILDGGAAGAQDLAAAGCAPLNGADSASAAAAQAVGVTTTQPSPSMAHVDPAAAWAADFGSQTLFLPGGAAALQYAAAVEGEFVKQCRTAADACYPPEPEDGGGGARQCNNQAAADVVTAAVQPEGAGLPVFLEPKCAGSFMPEPALAPVMDFMEAILGSTAAASAASASSLDDTCFSANAGMQSHCWIP
ncbi:MYB9 [Zea mays]|uniref:MYB9 n=1 Tax=Zea mays TaxID=4577 RepID=A0A1D6NEB5_MAIZE|nr:MYB9 [Zea mays]